MAGVHLAFASPAATIVEYSLGANPLLHELVEAPIAVTQGHIAAPTVPGLGIQLRADFVAEYRRSV
jgi:D-galactarolactone cycloisomerase